MRFGARDHVPDIGGTVFGRHDVGIAVFLADHAEFAERRCSQVLCRWPLPRPRPW